MALISFSKLLLHPPDGTNPVRKSSYYITLYGGLLALLLHSCFLFAFKLTGVTPLYYFNFISIATYLISFYLVQVKHRYHTGILIASIEVILHQVLAVYFLGWDYGFQYYLIAIASFLFAARFKNMLVPVSILVLSSIVMLWLFFEGRFLYSPHYQMAEPLRNAFYLFNLTASAFMIAFFAVINEIVRREYERQLLEVQDELLHAATTDELTGLYNRRQMRKYLDHEMARARRSGESFVIALGDVDNFKVVNDTYGHDVGDLLLKRVSRALNKNLREQDIIGRWGGEEFFLLLPETDLSGGMAAVEKVRETISTLTISHQKKSIQVTMTFGVAASTPNTTIDHLITEADHALYQGKHGTKNCTIPAGEITQGFASPSPLPSMLRS